MGRAARYAQQIAGMNFDGDDFVLPMIRQTQEENAAARKNETDFIFGVSVFLVKAGEHGVQVGRLWMHIDDVRRPVATTPLQFFNLDSIRREHVLGRSIRSHARKVPMLVFNAQPRQVIADRGFVFDDLVVCGKTKDSHKCSSSYVRPRIGFTISGLGSRRRRSSTSNRNSSASK